MGLESFINGAGIASKALDYVDTAVQYFNQKKLNRQAQSDTQENMQLQKDLNLQQVSDSYAAAVRGMRSAGINPAVAVGGVNMAQGVSSHPGSAGVAAKPENSFPAALEAGVALAQQKGQIENTKANTELQKAETELKRQEVKNRKQEVSESESRVNLNAEQVSMLKQLTQKYGTEQLILGTEYDRMLKEDSFAHAALMEFCDRRISGASSEAERDFWSSLRALGRTGKFNSGSLMAMKLFSEAWNSLDQTETEVGARAIQRFIQSIQILDDEFLETAARMPVYQAKLVFGQTAEAFQNAAFRKAYRKDLLPVEAVKLEEDVRVQKHNDPAGMIKDGDFLGFGVYFGSSLLRFGGSLLTARQFGRGGSLSDPRGKQPNGQPKQEVGIPQPGKTSSGHKPPNADRAAADEATKRSLYRSYKDKSKVDWLWSEYLRSRSGGINSRNANFNEFLLNRGIGERR